MSAPRREPNLRSFGAPDTQVDVRPLSEAPPARTVTEVIQQVNAALRPGMRDIWVRGEISGFKPASSGHWYFDLKDDKSLIPAAMFSRTNARVAFQPKEGMEVLVRGSVEVYSERGRLQMILTEMQPVGAGELALKFEQLKAKLSGEGLFATQRKRPIPAHPRVVGIVTSLQAAALRDMVRVATDRHPGIRLIVAAARVQGEGAAEEVAVAIARLNALAEVDVIIVGRGGGSVEDLWAFNEEVVVRAVAASRIPIVSAVGHETDFTLCDLAADLRAATPSNACEIVVPDADELHRKLDEGEERMSAALERLVPELRQKLDDMDARAQHGVRRTVQRERDALRAQAARLDALSPLAVLDRGYNVVRKDGKTLRTVDIADVGDAITIIARDGEIDAKVTAKRKRHE